MKPSDHHHRILAIVTSHRCLARWLFCSIFFYSAIGMGDEPSYPPTVSLETVRKQIDQAETTHPRLLASQKEFDQIAATRNDDPLRRLLAEVVIHQANLLIDAPPVERKLQGRRLLGQSRRCLKRVTTLAMAYHLTKDPRFAKRCEKEMLTAAQFSDWNPSHFLDVAEMTFALAIGYDWLYHQLTDSGRAEIKQAIVEKGVALPFTSRHKGWVRARNNWGQVCHGGLTAGALAVMEDEPDLAARTIHSALHNVTHSLVAYRPCGSYPEGPGYWSYGTSYNVILIAVLESCLGSDFGLSLAPGFDSTGQYLALTTGPSGLFFNYADGGAGRSPQSALFWFATRYNRLDWLFGERELLESHLKRCSRSKSPSDGDRLMPFSLLWMPATAKSLQITMPLNWFGQGHVPVTVHRSSWTDPSATYVGFKAGSPRASHGQMDIGSFVLDADGVRWATDLGAEGYHGIESRGMNLWSSAQNSDRWTIFRQSNDGHNTLVIDGQLQRVTGNAPIVAFSDDPDSAFSVADLSSLYKGQADSIQRGVRLLTTGEVLIQDELSGLKPGSRVRWGMITPGKPNEAGGTELTLQQDDAQMTLSLLSPTGSVWRIIDTAKPRNEWDSPNRGTCMAAFEAVAPESGKLALAVLATPGSCKTSAKQSLELRKLQNWAQ